MPGFSFISDNFEIARLKNINSALAVKCLDSVLENRELKAQLINAKQENAALQNIDTEQQERIYILHRSLDVLAESPSPVKTFFSGLAVGIALTASGIAVFGADIAPWVLSCITTYF